MKTPRELLLERHAAAQAGLDRARVHALDAVDAGARRERTAPAAPWWERLLGPNPRAWAGLAAVWLVLVAVNRGLGEPGAPGPAAAPPTSIRSRAALAETVREHRRQLAELLDLDEPTARAPGRAPASPKRSQQHEEAAMA